MLHNSAGCFYHSPVEVPDLFTHSVRMHRAEMRIRQAQRIDSMESLNRAIWETGVWEWIREQDEAQVSLLEALF